jgi:hypothetical protein
MDLFTKLLGDLLIFVYHCFDRIVIHDYRGYRADQILTDAAFDLASTRDPAVEKEAALLRREYAELLRKPQRNAEENKRLFDVIRRLEAPLPPPGETPLERNAAQSQQQREQLVASLLVSSELLDRPPGTARG